MPREHASCQGGQRESREKRRSGGLPASVRRAVDVSVDVSAAPLTCPRLDGERRLVCSLSLASHLTAREGHASASVAAGHAHVRSHVADGAGTLHVWSQERPP